MTDTTKKTCLKPIMRQLLMFEMFRHCKMIDNNVINQYFPYVNSKSRHIKFPVADQRRINRDLSDLKNAGVISYKYNEKEDYRESLPCDFKLRISPKESESKRKRLEKLNLLCRFLDIIRDIEDEITAKEDEAENEMDDSVFNYCMFEFEKHLESDKRSLTDLDLYRYDDPFVAEYIKLRGETTMEQIKEDFELLVILHYLYYDRKKRRFCVCDEYTYWDIRQDYGVVRGEDGKFYI